MQPMTRITPCNKIIEEINASYERSFLEFRNHELWLSGGERVCF